MNRFDQMADAIRDAEEVMRVADESANKLASILKGRLRKVSHWRLQELKRELKQFNAATCEWKEEA